MQLCWEMHLSAISAPFSSFPPVPNGSVIASMSSWPVARARERVASDRELQPKSGQMHLLPAGFGRYAVMTRMPPHVTQPCDAQEGLISGAVCGNFDAKTNTRSPLRGVTAAACNARQTPDSTSALVGGTDGSCRLPAKEAVAFAPRKYSLAMAR